jgi:hypothetical protein
MGANIEWLRPKYVFDNNRGRKSQIKPHIKMATRTSATNVLDIVLMPMCKILSDGVPTTPFFFRRTAYSTLGIRQPNKREEFVEFELQNNFALAADTIPLPRKRAFLWDGNLGRDEFSSVRCVEPDLQIANRRSLSRMRIQSGSSADIDHVRQTPSPNIRSRDRVR